MLADVHAVESRQKRQSDSKDNRLASVEYLLIMEDPRRCEGEHRDASGVTTGKGALRLGLSVKRSWWARAMKENAR